MTREEIIFVLSMKTNFSEEYLMGLPTKELENLYKERVEQDDGN